MKFLVLAAVHLALAAAKHTEIQAQFSTQVGSAGVEVKPLNSVGDRRGGLFLDLTFPSQGLLAEWQFYAVAQGQFFADIWDVDYTNDVATLVQSYKLQAEVTGFQSVEIPPVERVHIEPGYAIGLHYVDGDGDSILSWEREPATSGVKVSRVRLLDLYDQDLPNGLEVLTETTDRASPALRGILVGPNPNLRLVPEDGYRKGRVEVKLNDEWGTVCDKWFDVMGWPTVFCTELGFPGAEYANYTRSNFVGEPGDWARYEVPMIEWTTKPVHMQSPRCKLSEDRDFMACDIHPNGQCNHRLDMYVECLPRMRCAHNRTREREFKKHTIWTTSCVPEIYQDGSWGYVADTRPITDFKDSHTTWLAAFCKEIGYSNVKTVTYVNKQVGNFKPKVPVTYCNPTCSVPYPSRIGQCKPGPLVKGCHDINKVFYITCEHKRLTGYERPKRTRLTVEERAQRRSAKRQGKPWEHIKDELIREREERERQEREQREREERERQEREQREREERERQEREQREREERERQEREQREREEKEKEERIWEWEGNGRDGMTDEERRAARQSRRQPGEETAEPMMWEEPPAETESEAEKREREAREGLTDAERKAQRQARRQ